MSWIVSALLPTPPAVGERGKRLGDMAAAASTERYGSTHTHNPKRNQYITLIHYNVYTMCAHTL